MSQTSYRKKLIEVALPLEAINAASAREKSIRHGHPSTLHLWWARRPLAACRAVLFSSLVNDPSDDPMYGINEDTAATERAKLFDLIEDLVLWENSNNPNVINAARLEIARSIAANKVADGELEDDAQLVSTAPELPEEQAKYLPDPPPEYTSHDVRFKMPGLKPEQVNHFLSHYAPPVLDPFAGGGSIPLEAQRLGLRAYASDLNPVPVLINKALVEIPPRFAGQPPVNPEAQQGKLATKVYSGAEGLAEDVRYYGKWMRDEAEKRIGHLYPKVKVTQQMVDDGRPDLEPYVGQALTVIAWLWARTVKSPNPACKDAEVPLVRSFWLASKKDRKAWIAPIVDQSKGSIEFSIGVGEGQPVEGTIGKTNRCLISGEPMTRDYIRQEGVAGRLGERMIAVVAEGKRQRVYLPPLEEHEEIVNRLQPPDDVPDAEISGDVRYLTPVIYGMTTFASLFTKRQLTAMTTLCDLVTGAHSKIVSDSNGDTSLADAIATYLALAIGRSADFWTTMATWSWQPKNELVGHAFGRQAMPITWDFGEINPFSDSGGNFTKNLDFTIKALRHAPANCVGTCSQQDATSLNDGCFHISTDPPYYDNVPYADLSDFFYVWLRRSLKNIYPKELSTLLVPKQPELVADPFRHGGKNEARQFFENGMSAAFAAFKRVATADSPTIIYYAFKQEEKANGDGDEARSSTGWETFLQGLVDGGWSIQGTWPMRTERSGRLRSNASNALASSIVLACRLRDSDASMVTRRDFANALRKELPEAIKHLQSGNVAPVDLAQASIGPGMAVFSRYSKVVNADGSPMSVREALQLINQVLDESLVEQESDFDAETRFALRWFEQYGMSEGPFGDAETLAKAMAVSVTGVVEARVATSGAGKVRLLRRDELREDWDPRTDKRLTMWEITQYLIRDLETSGETGAGELLAKVGQANGEIARDLSYRLYQTCERKKLADEARSYNALVVAWPEVAILARQMNRADRQTESQAEMF